MTIHSIDMQCLNKRRYISEKSALNGHKRIVKRHGLTSNMKAYLCPHCDYYHIATTQIRNIRRR